CQTIARPLTVDKALLAARHDRAQPGARRMLYRAKHEGRGTSFRLWTRRWRQAYRSGFFNSEKRSGSRPCEGCSIGASIEANERDAGARSNMGSLGAASRLEVAPRQRSSTAPTKCASWPAETDGVVAMVASLRGN